MVVITQSSARIDLRRGRKNEVFSGISTDQRDNVEKDPVSEPVMTGDLLDPEVAGSTLPTDRGQKRDETESDQTPAARRRLVSKQRERRDADQELEPESSQRPRVETVSIADIQSSYPAPTETCDNYRGEEEFDGVCVQENLDVDEIEKLAEWHGFDGVATEIGIRAEAKSLSDFGVYEEVQSSDVRSGTRILGSRIVLREKHGGVKARLCAQDFAHLQKRDDLYSPTPSVTALRLLLSLVSSAFLHAPMVIETFVRPPQVYAKQGVIWRLRKALYGMRRAPKLFFNLLHEILSELGMQSLRSEPTFYFKGSLLFLVHVDDPLVAGTDEDIEWIFRELGQRMKFKPGPRLEIGKSVKYLGKMYTMTEHGFGTRRCDTFLGRIVLELGLDGCKPALTPGCEQLKPGGANEKASWLSPLDTEQTYRYRKLVGMLRFIAPQRPDLHFEIGVLSRGLSSPTGECWARLRRLGRYLAGTTRARLFVSRPQHTSNKTRQIVVWTDSDYAGDKQTRKSTSCALVFCDGTLVHGHSRRQTVVATSSAEAEYYSLAAGLQEALDARSILQELGEIVEIEVKCDSSAARAMANRVGLGRTKHVDAKYLWVQQVIQHRPARVAPVSSTENLSDIGTKRVPGDRLQELCRNIGLSFAENRHQ